MQHHGHASPLPACPNAEGSGRRCLQHGWGDINSPSPHNVSWKVFMHFHAVLRCRLELIIGKLYSDSFRLFEVAASLISTLRISVLQKLWDQVLTRCDSELGEVQPGHIQERPGAPQNPSHHGQQGLQAAGVSFSPDTRRLLLRRLFLHCPPESVQFLQFGKGWKGRRGRIAWVK